MSIAKTCMKGVVWFGATIVVLAGAIYIAFLAANWSDRAPSMSALRLEELHLNRHPIPDEDNAYVYTMGFSVERAEDPREWGIKRIAWAQSLLRNPQVDARSDLPGNDSSFESARSDKVQALNEMCKHVDNECQLAMEDNAETIAQWLATEEWLLNRYKRLLSHPSWLETMPFDFSAPLPSYSAVFDGQKLLFLKAWILAGQGNATGIKTLLGEDMNFWRKTLESSDMLLTKMIAVAALNRNFSWGNIILRRLPADVMMQGVPRLWRVPISESERSMLRCLTGEWVFANNMLKQIVVGGSNPLITDQIPKENSVVQNFSWVMLKPFLHFQASSNKYAELVEATAETLNVPYEQYTEALERVRAVEAQTAEDACPARHMYNIVGNILIAIAAPEFTSYAARVADLEGVRRAALLVTKLRSQHIESNQVKQHLRDAPNRNPYNGKPFLWDDSTDAIVFIGLEPGDRARHEFLY